MDKMLSEENLQWYYDVLDDLGGDTVSCDRVANTVTYHPEIQSNENRTRNAGEEELAHAVIVALLATERYKYDRGSIGHEIHFVHGSKGSNADEVDILIWDEDRLPFAMIEVKAASKFEDDQNNAIRHQLFGTAPLVGTPKLVVYATVMPGGPTPEIQAICIDYTLYKDFDAWDAAGQPHSIEMPVAYQDLSFIPYRNAGDRDLNLTSTSADFRAIATAFHNEFFGEHPDNTLFENLLKCLLAKIYDERTCKTGDDYAFQVFYRNSQPENASKIFERINTLYRQAYERYVDPLASDVNEIDRRDFSEESVKSVVQALQGVSITKGAARHGDVIGAFFEEILRAGFKQDRGMYFTHDNIVRFMVEALGLGAMTRDIWNSSNHPDNRLPYVIDPACGSGTFLLHAMACITAIVRDNESEFASDYDSEYFFSKEFSDGQPNSWAEKFLYGFDPKFIMAVTAKVNLVLHGDGSAHVFREDAFKPLSSYGDPRLRPCEEQSRSVGRAVYSPDLCERFDVVVSNPPFSITLPAETQRTLKTAFSLPTTTPSEGLFVERCFQLLKPGGRLAVVLPESLLNTKTMSHVRLLLYRFFHIRAIVSLPRNVFIDTPTQTSLLFAEKKTRSQIETWDRVWAEQDEVVGSALSQARRVLTKRETQSRSASEVAERFLSALACIITGREWISKGGKSPELLNLSCNWGNRKGLAAAEYYSALMKTADFKNLCLYAIFRDVAGQIDYSFAAYEVAEVGFKLSKRKEQPKPNHLCHFVGKKSGQPIYNLHTSDEPYEVQVIPNHPQLVLDFMRRDVKWGNEI